MPGTLEQECRVFCRYLAGAEPSPYVIEKYIEFHRGSRAVEGDAFDQFLLRFAAGAAWRARIADSYASRLRKYSVLRRKLVLVVALLECAPASFESLDTPDSGGCAIVFLKLAWWAAVYTLSLAAATMLLGPAHLALKGRPR